VARVAKKPVEIVGLSTATGSPPAPTESVGPIRLESTSSWPTTPRQVGDRKVITATALPAGGWLASLEAPSGYEVVAVEASGQIRRSYELPAGFYANIAVSPSGERALVSTRRRIDRFENPGSHLLDLRSGTHEVFGGTTVHAFISEDVVLAGVALMDVASRTIKHTVQLPGHRAKARSIAVSHERRHALIQTSHGEGLLVATTSDGLRALGVTPLRPAAVEATSEGLLMLADGRFYRVDLAD
jgi:hypothetical protein